MTEAFLSIVGIVVSITQTSWAAAALWPSTGRRATLAGLTKSVERWRTAVALAVLGVVVSLAAVPFSGWFLVATSSLALVGALGAAFFTGKRRDLEAEQEMRS